MGGQFENLNTAGLLAIGLIPEFVDQTPDSAFTGAPNSASDGVFLPEESSKAVVLVALREQAFRRTSRIVITVGDVATTYTVTVGAVAVPVTPASPVLSAIAIEIRDAIIASGPASAFAVASIDPDDLTGATVLLLGAIEDDYSIDAVAAAGTGALTFNADASSANVRLWLSHGGLVRSGSLGYVNEWTQPNGGSFGSVGRRGVTERVTVAGYRQGYLELDTIAGDGGDGGSITLNVARVAIGPCVLEATT